MLETTSRKRTLAELGIIVLGVLLALAAESAWSARSDRSREQEMLRDLGEEFSENARILSRDMATNDAALEAGAAWAKAMLGEIDVPEDSISELFINSRNTARFDPATAVLQSVLASGELSIIRNIDLRQTLAGWPDRAEEARNTSINATTQRANWAVPLAPLEAGGPYTPGEVALIRLDAARSDGGGFQLESLLLYVDSVQRMIEAELAR